MSALEDLEQRVTAKFAAKAAGRIDPSVFDPTTWSDVVDWTNGGGEQPQVPIEHQFSREHYVTYPNRRVIALALIDRALDHDEISEETWFQIAFLMFHGGRERIA